LCDDIIKNRQDPQHPQGHRGLSRAAGLDVAGTGQVPVRSLLHPLPQLSYESSATRT